MVDGGGSGALRLTIDAAGSLTNTGESAPLGAITNVACGPAGDNAVLGDRNALPSFLRSYTYPPLRAAATTTQAGQRGVSVTVSPNGSAAYVRSNTPATLQGFAYDEVTGALGGTPFVSITVAAAIAFFGVDEFAVHPDGSKLYVSEGNALNVYDAAAGMPLASIADPSLTNAIGVCLPNVAGADDDSSSDDDASDAAMPQFTTESTAGCSCEQILDGLGLQATKGKHGC